MAVIQALRRYAPALATILRTFGAHSAAPPALIRYGGDPGAAALRACAWLPSCAPSVLTLPHLRRSFAMAVIQAPRRYAPAPGYHLPHLRCSLCRTSGAHSLWR